MWTLRVESRLFVQGCLVAAQNIDMIYVVALPRANNDMSYVTALLRTNYDVIYVTASPRTNSESGRGVEA